ncbi:hypothetical protein E2C01_007788 [Portunus trituberculatus]|uniref:Uncharacterized protein n=1 Tax=Portunus trituberculatus TaxID=210409 RepID=A0A5B7D3B1_PORTR|nr:hypothetical protein [Portunus trituberculatus]
MVELSSGDDGGVISNLALTSHRHQALAVEGLRLSCDKSAEISVTRTAEDELLDRSISKLWATLTLSPRSHSPASPPIGRIFYFTISRSPPPHYLGTPGTTLALLALPWHSRPALPTLALPQSLFFHIFLEIVLRYNSDKTAPKLPLQSSIIITPQAQHYRNHYRHNSPLTMF